MRIVFSHSPKPCKPKGHLLGIREPGDPPDRIVKHGKHGEKCKTIMAGTVIEVAIIWVLQKVPMAAPRTREVTIPAAITSRKASNFFRCNGL